MKKIKIIGLTGQSGAGKSTAAEYFLKRNITVINADLLVRKLYTPDSACVKSLAGAFGKDILAKNGEIIRQTLAERAFSSKETTNLLNSLVHPFVMSLFLQEVKKAKQNGEEFVVYDAPQLFESNADIICDFVISVVADKDKRLKRICKRDKIDEKAGDLRLSAQLDEEFFVKNSDFVIENNSDIESLLLQAENVLDAIFER